MRLTRGRLARVYATLHRIYGPQRWWPADKPFEMMAGAVLVQNTAWVNASRAIAALKRAKLLSAAKVAALPLSSLAGHIRSSGTHRVKARRLKALSRWLLGRGGVARAGKLETGELRRSLLAVHGVGPETADCILLYVFGRPVFVADAYARRFLSRYGFDPVPERYEPLRQAVESVFMAGTPLFKEFHALIVRHSKVLCRARPLCERCSLRRTCAYAIARANPGIHRRPAL
jgi:endonuclease III related protein